MRDAAKEILFNEGRLRGERSNWDTQWQQIAERCAPSLANFTSELTPGARNTSKMHDSTASLAATNFAAAMVGMTAPRQQLWHGLRSGIDELDQRPAVKRYFEIWQRKLFYHRYAPLANFANQYHEVQHSLGLFGPGALWVDEDIGRGMVYRSVHIAEIVGEEDQHGRMMTLYRKFKLSATNAQERWGEAALTARMRKSIADGKGHEKYEFVHALRPRRKRQPNAPGWRNMPIESIVVGVADGVIITEGGYRSMPLLFPRYTASAREPYGRSPAMQALPDIKMVNQMTRDLVNASQLAIKPPMVMHDDGVLGRLQMTPGALNRGGLSMDGRMLVQPLATGTNIPIGREILNDSRELINKAFLVPLFSILTETPDRMTATEVLERAKEKGVLLSPAAGRIEAEVLGPMIEREMDIIELMGQAPQIPPELQEANGEYRITYDNPLTRAAKSERSIGFLRTVEALGPIAQANPDVWAEFDLGAAARGLAEDNGVPPSWMRDPAEREAEKADKAMQEQAGALLQGAGMAGDAALSLAKAQQVAAAPGAPVV